MSRPRMARPPAVASYSRYSSDLQQIESLADQRRKCRDHAEGLGLAVDPGLEYADEAISGTKLAREGLDRLLTDARARRFGVLILENLSRLARESVITMPLMKELVELLGIRVISVGEGVDTDRPGWELHASILSIQHERFVKDLGGYVFRGQEGVVLAGLSVGDMCLGYGSEAVPGSESTRRGRHPRPRMRYVIDDEEAGWVLRIFRWFAEEKRSMGWIARELTRLGAPKDHRATTAAWHPRSVRRVLENTKYIGAWPWGRLANWRNPFDGKVSQDERPTEESARWARHLPDLRIVDDELWGAAQARLAEVGGARRGVRRPDGRLAGSAADRAPASPRHLLAGLLRCEACGMAFQVCGPRGDYLGCRGHLTGQCDRETRVPRDRAARLILGAIAERVLASPAWHREVLDALRAEHESLRDRLPGRLGEARKQLAAVTQRIARLVDAIEGGAASSDVGDRLALRRAEAGELERSVAELGRAEEGRPPEPTGEWVAARFGALESVLAAGGPAAALALRDLVGGRISVRRIERPGRSRHYLQARFTIRSAGVAKNLRGEPPPADVEGAGGQAGRADEIIVDLRELAPWEEVAEEAKALWDRGLTNGEIAERLGCDRNQVTKAIAAWHARRGLEPPDGRARWRRLAREGGRPASVPFDSLAGELGNRPAI